MDASEIVISEMQLVIAKLKDELAFLKPMMEETLYKAIRNNEIAEQSIKEVNRCLDYADKIREWRLKNNWGLRDFAKMIKISPTELSQIEGHFIKPPKLKKR